MVMTYPHSPKEIIDESPFDDETQGIQIVDHAGYPVLTFDADDYREYVRDMELTREQEDELLEALWSIVVGFIDLGFGIKASSRSAPKILLPNDNQEKRNSSEKGGIV